MDSQNQHNLGMLAEDYTDKILNSTASLIDLGASNQIELVNVLTGNEDSGGKNVLKGNFLEGFFFGDDWKFILYLVVRKKKQTLFRYLSDIHENLDVFQQTSTQNQNLHMNITRNFKDRSKIVDWQLPTELVNVRSVGLNK